MIDKSKIQSAMTGTFDGCGTSFEAWHKHSGKVREVYRAKQSNNMLIVATDRLSAFDRHVCTIPFKGQVLNQLSRFWFEATREVVPSHFIAEVDANAMLVHQKTMLPIEVVVRGYLTGVTATSIWKAYHRGERIFFGNILPHGLQKNEALPTPIVTPTTKGKTDTPISSLADLLAKKLVSLAQWQRIESYAKNLYQAGCEVALKNGFVLVDTKYEFGVDDKGDIFLCDELHTPDSSRYWRKKSYENFLVHQGELQHYDKEFFRLHLEREARAQNIDLYDTQATLPSIADEIKIEMSSRYIELYEALTGKEFVYPTQLAVSRLINIFKLQA